MCLYAGQAVLATPLTFVHKIYMNVWWKKKRIYNYSIVSIDRICTHRYANEAKTIGLCADAQ